MKKQMAEDNNTMKISLFVFFFFFFPSLQNHNHLYYSFVLEIRKSESDCLFRTKFKNTYNFKEPNIICTRG